MKSLPDEDKGAKPEQAELRIANWVKAGAVENMGQNGIERNPQSQPLYSILDAVRARTRLSRLTQQELGAGRTTRVVVAPLKALPPDVTGVSPASFFARTLKKGQPTQSTHGNWTLDDIAVCISFRVQNAAPDGSSGQLGAIAIMSPQSADTAYQMIAEDPRVLYALVRKMNGGLVRQFDGLPAKIATGPNVLFLPNNPLGGPLSQIVESRPFPANFNPNPIY